MKIATQLGLLVGALAAAMIALGVLGLYGQNAAVQGLNNVYHDRVVSLWQLESIVENYAVNIVDSSHKIHDGLLDWSQGRENVTSALAEIDSDWEAYRDHSLVSQEQRLVDEVRPLMERAETALARLREILQRQDQAALEEFLIDTLYPT
ncbi:MAG: MCP four helix bundle domain-containing protein, partial [Halochromatium sp.]